MHRKLFTLLLACIGVMLMPATSHAGFLTHKATLPHLTPPSAATANEPEEYDDPIGGRGGHGHSGGHSHGSHGHVHAHGGSHWHGTVSHYHGGGMHHTYHPHYHYYSHGRHRNSTYHGHETATFGGLAMLFDIITPAALLLFGSLPAIVFSAGGTLAGGLGVISDHHKHTARLGLIIGATELAILATLYALYVI